jgi:hypothetical protein
MFPPIDTKSATAVAEAVRAIMAAAFPGASLQTADRLFVDVEAMFTGHYLDYQAVDLGYHDFEHTLQATLCFARLFAGRHVARAEPLLSVRQFELGLAAALLHDTGYLKLRSDRAGTCAKYTHVHVLRSCAFAASYLPAVGFTLRDTEIVTGAIRCTGPVSRLARLYFNARADQLLGCMLVTADYLGQMAATDYPDELDLLFHEFFESDEFFHLPTECFTFQSARELIEKTPDFWTTFIRPRLEKEFEGVYRFLASPYPDGPNPYVDAIERNIALVRTRIPAGTRSG